MPNFSKRCPFDGIVRSILRGLKHRRVFHRWALGVTTFELITGRLPFHLEDPIDNTREAITKAKYEWPKNEQFKSTLESFVRRCLTVDAASTNFRVKIYTLITVSILKL